MLFTFEGANAKSHVIKRRTQRPGRDMNLEAVSQIPIGSASDNLIAETRCFVLDSLLYGEPV